MKPKPSSLGPEHASSFCDPSVVAAYRHRPDYPPETFDHLADLAVETGGAVLDAGCGTGYLARPLAMRGLRVDAVDPSAPMIAAGRRLDGGDRVNWVEAPMETAPLDPPYALVTAGHSLHWMEWEVVLPRFGDALLPGGRLVIVSLVFSSLPWDAAVSELVARFTTNPDYEPVDLVHELESRELFRREGEMVTAAVPLSQTVEDLVESFHSTSFLSRDRMTRGDAAEFDAAVERLVRDAHPEGRFTSEVRARLVYGQVSPSRPRPSAGA